jgi:hypothetical protein
MTAAITFEDIEQRADRALAYALLAKTASTWAVAVYRGFEIARSLEEFVRLLSPETLHSFTPEQRSDLCQRLQVLHRQLLYVGSREVQAVAGMPLLGGLFNRIEESSEDIADAIEDLVLDGSPAFQRLISSCASNIGL